MAQPTYNYKVTTPFAINGSKDEIPTTTEDGSVSLENGYGTLYETPPSEGGRFIRRGEWNYLINFLYNAIKELQDIITAGEFTVSASQTLTSILPIALGGTGASTQEDARSNLGLGNVNNTSDLNKPISTATQEALNGKYDKTGGIINGQIEFEDLEFLGSKATIRNQSSNNFASFRLTHDTSTEGRTTSINIDRTDTRAYIYNTIYCKPASSNDRIAAGQLVMAANESAGTSNIVFNFDSCGGRNEFFEAIANKLISLGYNLTK